MVFVLLVLGLVVTAGGGRALWAQLTGPPTPAAQAAATRAQMAARWAQLTAGQVFPATIGYVTPAGVKLTAHRVGVAPWAPCAAVLSPLAASALRQQGCIAVLRATYADASATMLVTTGIAVMPSTRAARAALKAATAHGNTAQVTGVPFPGTAAAGFGNPRSEIFGVDQAGPDLVLAAMGYANGEYERGAAVDPALIDFAAGVVRTLASRSSGISGCRGKAARC